MATAATVKQVQVKQTKPRMVEASLEGVYEAGEEPAATRSTIQDRCTVQERGKTVVPVDGPEARGDSRRLWRQAR